MTRYLISFPADSMRVAPEDLAAVGDDASAVVDAARDAGVYVFAGGLDEASPVLVPADGTLGEVTRPLDGGMTVIDVPTRDEAIAWAARIAAACRCPQEVRAFGDDPRA